MELCAEKEIVVESARVNKAYGISTYVRVVTSGRATTCTPEGVEDRNSVTLALMPYTNRQQTLAKSSQSLQ